VLDYAPPGARLVFSCGWHITRDGQDVYSWNLKALVRRERLPAWSRHVGDPILESNITRRVDLAGFMVEALENDELVHEAPAIVGRQTPSALAHAGDELFGALLRYGRPGRSGLLGKIGVKRSSARAKRLEPSR
jgi:hypothetical protein